MFVVNKTYFSKEFTKYNSGHEEKLSQDDFYGVYFLVNGKLTNYKPVVGTGIVESKNNKI